MWDNSLSHATKSLLSYLFLLSIYFFKKYRIHKTRYTIYYKLSDKTLRTFKKIKFDILQNLIKWIRISQYVENIMVLVIIFSGPLFPDKSSCMCLLQTWTCQGDWLSFPCLWSMRQDVISSTIHTNNPATNLFSSATGNFIVLFPAINHVCISSKVPSVCPLYTWGFKCPNLISWQSVHAAYPPRHEQPPTLHLNLPPSALNLRSGVLSLHPEALKGSHLLISAAYILFLTWGLTRADNEVSNHCLFHLAWLDFSFAVLGS